MERGKGTGDWGECGGGVGRYNKMTGLNLKKLCEEH